MTDSTRIPGTPRGYDHTTSPWDPNPDVHGTHAFNVVYINRADQYSALQTLGKLGAVVYAMRVTDGVIKIGHTSRPGKRRNEIAGEILAFRFGSRVDEQLIHASLKAHRHHGYEWYYPTPEVMAVVNDMRADLGMEPLAA